MITVTILTKNSAETLEKTLNSTLSFSEVLVYDTGSTDETIQIAQRFSNVKVLQGEFIGFGPTHNKASGCAKHDWIFSIDSDEVVSMELAEEVLALSLDPKCVYAVLRHNYFNGKRVKGCAGWHPDWVARLYHRKETSFTTAYVHEKIVTDHLHVHKLSSPLLHTPYRQMADFLAKMQSYTSLFADQNQKGKSASLLKAIFHGWFAFFKSYVLKKGFLVGKEGLIISIYNGHTAFYKYLKLLEKNKSSL